MGRKFIAILVLTLSLAGCGDDEKNKDLGKMAITAGGAAGGALIASKMSSEKNKTMATVVGAAAGGALGYYAGGALMKNK